MQCGQPLYSQKSKEEHVQATAERSFNFDPTRPARGYELWVVLMPALHDNFCERRFERLGKCDHAGVAEPVDAEIEFHQVPQRPHGVFGGGRDRIREGDHPGIRYIVAAEPEHLQIRQRPAGDDRRERRHARSTDLVIADVEPLQIRTASPTPPEQVPDSPGLPLKNKFCKEGSAPLLIASDKKIMPASPMLL
eukprot:6710066-Prymnesium_polylepis.5